MLVDPASLDLLAGSELDYTDELMGSHFAVRNPNAKSACGCGTSFSPDRLIQAAAGIAAGLLRLALAVKSRRPEDRHLERQLDPPAREACRKLAGALPA